MFLPERDKRVDDCLWWVLFSLCRLFLVKMFIVLIGVDFFDAWWWDGKKVHPRGDYQVTLFRGAGRPGVFPRERCVRSTRRLGVVTLIAGLRALWFMAEVFTLW